MPETITILLAEDNPGDARLIREMLSDAPGGGIDLAWEPTLAAALERARRGDISAVLLDLTLPDGSGLDTLHAVYREMPHMPIVVLTGIENEELANSAMRDGAQDYLVKGHIDSSTLVRSVRYAIGRAHTEAARARTERELEAYRTKLEEMVTLRTAELLAANLELGAALAARTRFLASVSHELRTPLNSIIGFSQILLTDAPGHTTDEQRRQLEMIHVSGQHLLEIINQILDLTRIDHGQEEFAISNFDPCALAAEVVESLEPLARDHEDTIRLARCEGADETLASDESKIRQVLLNLVGNAVKYTESGTITITIRREGADVDFLVEDTGPGIPAETLERLFIEFERGTVMNREGAGLGLAIALALARALGGDIEARSEVGVGSTFRFHVPEYARIDRRQGDRRTPA
jgi:two-component system, sensor histidine kinase